MDTLKQLKKGKIIVDELSEEELVEALQVASDAYHNKQPIISDDLYDEMFDFLESIDPDNPFLTQIGAPSKDDKEDLPYHMGSMNKIKDDEKSKKKLQKWIKDYDGPYVLSDKEDGISGLYVNIDGNIKLLTRGNGSRGRDISHLIPFLKIPEIPESYAIRGEIIIENSVFIPLSTANGGIYKNARNLAAGIVNQKKDKLDKKLAKLLQFVTYELIEPQMKPSKQYKELEGLGFRTAHHVRLTKITGEILLEYYLERKEESKYRIDGIIVTEDKKHPRNTAGNPEYSFAYKGPSKILNIEVLDIEWNPNKDGEITPKLKLEPTEFEDVTVRNVLAHHAKYVVENGIGRGAIVKIVRSNELLPYIVEVVKPAKPTMPKLDYVWDANGVKIKLKDPENNEAVIVRRLIRFFESLEIDFMNEGMASRLFSAGYNSIIKIVKMTVDDFLEIPGIKDTLAKKLYNSLQTGLKKVTLLKLMVGSNIFGKGFAMKKLKKILDKYPDIVDEFTTKDIDEWRDNLISIDSMGDITVDEFLQQLPVFQKFLSKFSKYVKVPPHKSVIKNNKLGGKSFVFTGVRDQELEKKIEELGGKLGSSVSKNTYMVVYKKGGESNFKYVKAVEINKDSEIIKIVTIDDFKKNFEKLIK